MYYTIIYIQYQVTIVNDLTSTEYNATYALKDFQVESVQNIPGLLSQSKFIKSLADDIYKDLKPKAVVSQFSTSRNYYKLIS